MNPLHYRWHSLGLRTSRELAFVLASCDALAGGATLIPRAGPELASSVDLILTEVLDTLDLARAHASSASVGLRAARDMLRVINLTTKGCPCCPRCLPHERGDDPGGDCVFALALDAAGVPR